MKIVEQTPTRLILRKDGKWINAIISGLSGAIIGLICVYVGIVNLFTGADTIIYFGFIVLGVCITIVMPIVSAGKEEEVTCFFDISLGCMILKRRSMLGTKIINFPLDKIIKVIVTEHKITSPTWTSKYGSLRTWITYKISLVIKYGGRIRISLSEDLDANSCSHLAECIAEFLQIPLNTPF